MDWPSVLFGWWGGKGGRGDGWGSENRFPENPDCFLLNKIHGTTIGSLDGVFHSIPLYLLVGGIDPGVSGEEVVADALCFLEPRSGLEESSCAPLGLPKAGGGAGGVGESGGVLCDLVVIIIYD